MKNIFRILLILAIVGVPCGTHAAKKDLTDNVTYSTPAKGFGAADDNDTELYDILSGTTPTLGPLNIGGTGDSWLELSNNTSLVDDITGKYGIRFSSGVLQQIINGTPSAIGSGGGGTGYVATPTYSDTPCTLGEYSWDSTYWYACEATDQWDRFAITWTAWSNPSVTCSGTGTLGYTDVSTHTETDAAMYANLTASGDICVTVGRIEVTTAFTSSQTLRIVVWDSSGTEIATSNELTGDSTAEVKEIAFPTAFQISNGTAYRLGFVGSASIEFRRIFGGPVYYKDGTYASYPSTDAGDLTWVAGATISPIISISDI